MSAVAHLDNDLHDKFFKLEDDFFDSFFNGSTALSAFVKGLSSLQATAKNAIAETALSKRTIALTRSTASSIRSIADNFRELEPRTRRVDEKRKADIADVFRRLSLADSDSDALSKDVYPTAQTAAANVTDEAVAPHIPQSYNWLLKHIHNPYPSPAVKAKISAESGAPVKTINDWFINARRRTGWTSVSKRYFGSCRALTVDCAHRVFVSQEASHPVPKQILDAFLSYKKSAELIYDGLLEHSCLAKTLEKAVENLSQKPADAKSKRTRKQPKVKEDERKPDRSSKATLPIPAPLALVDPPKRTACSSATHPYVRKRRTHCLDDEEDNRTVKRSRMTRSDTPLSNPSDRNSFRMEIPSNPSPSSPQSHYLPESSSSSASDLCVSVPSSPPASRKRRLSQSDTGSSSPRKRQRDTSSSPDRLWLSNSLPLTNGVSIADTHSGFDSNPSSFDFNMPAIVSLSGEIFEGELDFSTASYPNIDMTESIMTMGHDVSGSLADDCVAPGTILPDSAIASAQDLNQIILLLNARENSTSAPSWGDLSLPDQSVDITGELCGLPAMPTFSFDFQEAPSPPTESSPTIYEQHSTPEFGSPQTDFSVFSETQSLPSSPDFPPELQSYPSICSDMYNDPLAADSVLDMSQSDRQTKLGRLRQLKEERQRLMEEELRLEYDLRAQV